MKLNKQQNALKREMRRLKLISLTYTDKWLKIATTGHSVRIQGDFAGSPEDKIIDLLRTIGKVTKNER